MWPAMGTSTIRDNYPAGAHAGQVDTPTMNGLRRGRTVASGSRAMPAILPTRTHVLT
jgi:hypothetical protein